MNFLLCIFFCQSLGWVSSQELMALNPKDALNSESEESVSSSTEEVSSPEIFVPTSDWQEIKPGQSIPRGLHVRINMETGKKEAKFLVNKKEEEKEKEEPNYNYQELKEALKNIKNDAGSDDIIKSKFRSLDELKKDFKEFEVKVESDVNAMIKLIKNFVESKSDEEKINIVENLEYYVHQVDNAVDFLTVGGLEQILVPSLNSSSTLLQEMAGFLIGSSAQSNPRVQIAYLEAGFINTLLRMVSSHSSPEVSGKALYGLSAILRNFPEAQNTFLRHGGLDVLRQVFNYQGNVFDKIKIKILTLIQDMQEERRDIDISTQDGYLRSEQYRLVNLESMLSTSGWCQVFQTVLVLPREDRRTIREDILSTVSDEFPLRVEHDYIEKIVTAMLKMKDQCQTEFKQKDVLDKLNQLAGKYKELSNRELIQDDTDIYFSSLLQIINSILATGVGKTEL
ncbi:nucleotide exchange factor SIL1 [Eurytemora carolleeae]|uniref:nucleotide exchange factor SIL1 n=1 Tax=Eurytemora carolleeae TaxID=1294199 RepID=UPI000C75C1DA|nr:nucleotide exchange factor SIL1 [Eurytemora carolleeae]|eukprot:XP_023326178.1 nucleotide exchange factor SIL1-like [Eurytemora affinis]